MATQPRRVIDPLNPAGSVNPRLRIGQGISGGGVDPLNPGGAASSLLRSRPRISPLDPGGSFRQSRQVDQGTFNRLNRLAENYSKQFQDAVNSNWRKDYDDLEEFERKNIPIEYRDVFRDILEQRKAMRIRRHGSPLQNILKVVGAIEGAGSGFLKGAHEFQKEQGITSWKDQWKYLANPSLIYREFGAGFSEIPESVAHSYSYTQLAKDTNDPGSFAYRYAPIIGLSMAVLWDPTTYISFGATSTSKSIAYRALAETDKQAVKAAERLIKANRGKIVNTVHGPVKASYDNFDEIVSHVKVESGMPMTLGDALAQLQQRGLELKQEIRQTGKYFDPKTGEMVDASLRKKITARALPSNVKGGQGVRLAGKTIPGTIGLGTKLAGGTRTGISKSGLGQDVGEALIPAWGARHVVDDAARASALVEMTTFKTGVQKAQTDIARTVREMQRPVIRNPDDISEYGIDEGLGKARVLVRPEERAGLLTRTGKLEPAQRVLRDNIKVAAGVHIEKAVSAGLQRKQITKLWDDLAKYYDDPLMALAEFKFKATARTMAHTFVEQMLRDRRFALPLSRLDDVGKAMDEHLLLDAPEGWTKFAYGTRQYAVRNSVIDGIKDLSNPTRLDTSLQRGFRRLNIAQNWWKLYATSPNPAFHVMNFLGAVWNNALAGIYNPVDYFDALKTLYRGRKEEAAQVGSKFGAIPGLRRVPESTEAGKAAQATLAEAEARSGLGRTSFLFGDISRGHYSPEQLAMSDVPTGQLDPMYQRMAHEGMEKGKGIVGRTFTPEGGFRSVRPNWREGPRDELGVPIVAWNPETLENQNFRIGENEFFVSVARDRETGKIYSSTRDHTEIWDDLSVVFGAEKGFSTTAWDQYTVLANRKGKVLAVNGNDLNATYDLEAQTLVGATPDPNAQLANEIKTHIEAKFAAGAKEAKRIGVQKGPKLPKGVSRMLPGLDEWDDVAEQVTPKFLKENPWAQFFPIAVMPDGEIRVGFAGMAHEDSVLGSDYVRFLGEDWASRIPSGGDLWTMMENAGYREATGILDAETGRVLAVNLGEFTKNPVKGATDLRLGAETEAALEKRVKRAAEAVLHAKVPEVKGPLRKKAIARQYGVTVPRKLGGVALAATGNPMAFALFLPELGRIGRRVGGTIEDLVRLTPFEKFSNDPQIMRYLAEYGPINSSLRVEYKRFTKADQQAMFDIGADISRKFQFDYSDLTNFERYVAKSVFPFWVYYKNNLALQVTQMVKQPRVLATTSKVINFINENGKNYELGPWEEITPAYFDNLHAFQVPVPASVREMLGLPQDMPLFLNPKLPFLSINLIPNLWPVLRDPNMTTSQKMLEVMAPLFGNVGPFSTLPFPGGKILLEAGTGYNLGLNRPIDYQRQSSNDLRQGYVPAPGWFSYLPEALRDKVFHGYKDPKTGEYKITQTSNYVLEQLVTPFINNLGQAVPQEGGSQASKDRARADLVSWMTGVRLMPFDVLRADRNLAYQMKGMLEAKQSELRQQGLELDPEDAEMLKIVRADLKVIEAVWDERENPDGY